jgi:FtsZ-binding cell division protein ZapB
MENLEDNLIAFRPNEKSRRIINSNKENTGMSDNELMNYFIVNNQSKQRPIIDKHEGTIKSQSEEIEAYQEEIETLKEDKLNLQQTVSEYKSKVSFLNAEKENFVHIEELEKAQDDFEKAKYRIVAMDDTIRSYETNLLDDCFENVKGITLYITGDSDEEFEISTKADLVNALVFQYSLHLKGFETEIDEEEEDED